MNIIDAIESVNMFDSYYYNKKTKEILFHSDFDEEMSTITEDDYYNDDIIALPTYYEINDYGIMESFIETIDNPRIYNELIRKIQGKGAFRRFKQCIDYYNLTDKWYKFRDDAYEEIAKKWCKENNLNYEEICSR